MTPRMPSMWNRHRDRRAGSRSAKRAGPRGFTLIELLVVMGIIAVLGVLTTISYSAIAKDARLSSAKNAVAAVLDNARGLAMKNNRIIIVVFRPMLDSYNKQRVEAVTAQWSGESVRVNIGSWQVVDRFVPVPGVPVRVLPEGIKVAGPGYGSNSDATWMVLSHLPKINQSNGNGEAPGEIIGVMYASDGTTISRNSATDSARLFVDFDNGGDQDWGTGAPPIDYSLPVPSTTATMFNSTLFEHHLETDEPFVDIAPFIAVFDDDEVRQIYDPTRWDLTAGGSFANRLNDYAQYIGNNIDPIYFNRYTGVAMK